MKGSARWWIGIAIAAAVLVVSVGGVYLDQHRAAQATDGVSTSPRPPDDQVHAQEILGGFVGQALKTSDTSGYAGSTIDIPALTVTIEWTDPVPADVQALAGTDPASGAHVSLIVVPYSQDQIEAAGERLLSSAASEGLVQPNVTGATSDSAGLRIEVSPVDLNRALSESSAFAEMAGMPVQIVAGATAPPHG